MAQATVSLRTGEGLRRGHILMGGWVPGGQREGRARRYPGRGEKVRWRSHGKTAQPGR